MLCVFWTRRCTWGLPPPPPPPPPSIIVSLTSYFRFGSVPLKKKGSRAGLLFTGRERAQICRRKKNFKRDGSAQKPLKSSAVNFFLSFLLGCQVVPRGEKGKAKFWQDYRFILWAFEIFVHGGIDAELGVISDVSVKENHESRRRTQGYVSDVRGL